MLLDQSGLHNDINRYTACETARLVGVDIEEVLGVEIDRSKGAKPECQIYRESSPEQVQKVIAAAVYIGTRRQKFSCG